MAEVHLRQTEADELFAMAKVAASAQEFMFPSLGEKIILPLTSVNQRENFHIDVTRSRIKLLKMNYSHRARNVIVLRRLDLNGAPHTNPDGQEMECPHLHVYTEGFADKWAYPISPETFPDLADLYATLHSFMHYCNVTTPPLVVKGLFSS